MLSLSVSAAPYLPEPLPSGALQLSLEKLNKLGSVLYIAAHPDDENTKLIAYLANGERVDTTYLSLTRGDGGQNLVGSDLGEKLGLIRTHELMMARRIDGGQQRFSRAIDFGYSKTPEETLKIWDHEAVLADTVWAIRSLRPDVIITRFSLEPGYTHGHHTASTLLAKEAFAAAADASRFPEQLKFVEPWSAKRLLWNTSSWFYRSRNIEFDPNGLFFLETGGYNPLLGAAYTEIAAKSRSAHKSQGFGSTAELGESKEYFMTLAGSPPEGNLFSGIDTTWQRLPGASVVAESIARAIKVFDPAHPEVSVPALIEAHRALSELPEGFWRGQKLQDIEAVIAGCLALDVESVAGERSTVPGAELDLIINAIQRSSLPVTIAVSTVESDRSVAIETALPTNQLVSVQKRVPISANTEISQPYWLLSDPEPGRYVVDDQSLIGFPENQSALPLNVEIKISGYTISYQIATSYKYNDPVNGEVKVPLSITPPVMVNLEEPTHIFGHSEAREFAVRLFARASVDSGTVHFKVDSGWRVEPEQIQFSAKSGDEVLLSAKLIPPLEAGETTLQASVEFGGKVYNRGFTPLHYDHIPDQALFPVAKARAVLLDVQTAGSRIGYIPGAGDSIPEALGRIGYAVDTLTEADMDSAELSKYDAIILGIRAVNTNNRIGFYLPALFEYSAQGGVVILQYNTNRSLQTDDFAPYPITISRDRVTDEFAEMRFLAPEHPVMHFPNQITSSDFDGWVQERGLYFADAWDPVYRPIFSANDLGEAPVDGGLLIAEHGEGFFVYTGLSWFRQLPAGVPGAYRIFANLVSLGHAAE